MIRQTDNIRVSALCLKPTRYPCNDFAAMVYPQCVYLSNDGKCEAKCCFRLIQEGNHADQRDGM